MSRLSLPYLFFWCFAAWSLGGMHFFMHNPGGSGLYLPFNMTGWILISLMTGLGLWQMTLNRVVVYSRFHLCCWLACLLMLVPLLYSHAELAARALPRLAGLAGGLLFWFALLQCRFNEQQRWRLLYFLLAAVSLEITLGLVQYYLLEPGNAIGYNTKANRPYGIFQQPNVMASFMATGLLLAWYLWLADRRTLPAIRRVWLGAVLITTALLLIVLQSRVGLLGGLAGILLMLPFSWQRSRRETLLLLGLVTLGVGLAVISLSLVDSVQRNTGIYSSPGIRQYYWQQSLALMGQHLWTGVGYGDFERQFMEFYTRQRELIDGLPPMEPNLNHPHNELLLWGVEGGLLPVLAIVSVALMFIWQLRKLPWRHALAMSALVWPIALHSQTEYPFYHSLAHWITLLVLLYWIDLQLQPGQQIPYRPRLLARFSALLLPLLVVTFMFTGLQTARVVTLYERGGSREPALLQSALNPLAWLGRIEFNAMSLRLKAGAARQDEQALQDYLNWGQEYVRHTPRASVYRNMVLALHFLDRPEEAQQLLLHARHYYPGEQKLSHTHIQRALSAAVSAPATAVPESGTNRTLNSRDHHFPVR
ncbi:Wzy polymerase domain-containing protein [Oceanimonas baumannii]|uniref:PglL family O-oligosaccharyltransferase n=1 Tax=Oceanimonas baumannii TaxID=129578 RepID=UPI001D194B3E|nr:Wzy polymerase domain-containing protein [Oceanimonas baumannii]MCC4264887.1 Wzy polymerase domain-containing protein [Oceanimonas baumannii]